MRDRQTLGITSVGYFIAHPLESTITVRVALNESADGTQAHNLDYSALFARMRVHCARHVLAVMALKSDDIASKAPAEEDGDMLPMEASELAEELAEGFGFAKR